MNAIPLTVVSSTELEHPSARPWGVQVQPVAGVVELGELVFRGFAGPYQVALRGGRITLASELTSAELPVAAITSVAVTAPGMYGVRTGELGITLMLPSGGVLRLVAPTDEAEALVRALGRPTFPSELLARRARA